MPASEVLHKFKHGILHSGSKSGPKVKNKKQALAIMFSERKAEAGGKKEYQSKHGIDTSPSKKIKQKHSVK